MYALAVWVELPTLSLCASLIFPAFAQLSLPHVESSVILSVHSSLSLSCDGFRALLEVFGISMFTTNSKTTLQSKNSDYKSMHTCSWIICTQYACPGRATYNVRHIYIYQRNSAVQLTRSIIYMNNISIAINYV